MDQYLPHALRHCGKFNHEIRHFLSAVVLLPIQMVPNSQRLAVLDNTCADARFPVLAFTCHRTLRALVLGDACYPSLL